MNKINKCIDWVSLSVLDEIKITLSCKDESINLITGSPSMVEIEEKPVTAPMLARVKRASVCLLFNPPQNG